MNMTSHAIVDIKGCQYSKHISISVFQTERFPKWVKLSCTNNSKMQIKSIVCLKSTFLCIDVTVYTTRVLSVD